MSEKFTITSRYLVKEQGWKTEIVEHDGDMQAAWREASRYARALDDTYGDDHFWSVTLGGGKYGAAGDIVQLFHGRLI